MESLTLVAPDISCAHCQSTIERELSTLPGMHSVSVDIPTRHVRVSYDPSRLSSADIIARLDDEGFPVTT